MPPARGAADLSSGYASAAAHKLARVGRRQIGHRPQSFRVVWTLKQSAHMPCVNWIWLREEK